MVSSTGALSAVSFAVLSGLPGYAQFRHALRRAHATRRTGGKSLRCQNLALDGDLMFDQNNEPLRMEEDFMVTIATFNEPAKARQLKRRFQDSAIKADVHNEAPMQQFGFMSKPQANAKVMVEDNDFEKAQSLMIEWESTDPDISAALIRCPQCNSSNIEYPQMTRKFLTPALVGVLCALKIIPKEFYCQDCHFTWTNREEPTIGRLWHRFFPGSEAEQG